MTDVLQSDDKKYTRIDPSKPRPRALWPTRRLGQMFRAKCPQTLHDHLRYPVAVIQICDANTVNLSYVVMM